MPPEVEPMPVDDAFASRLIVPLDAHDASYLAASARIASFCINSKVLTSGVGFSPKFLRASRFGQRPRNELRRREMSPPGLMFEVVPWWLNIQ